MLPFRLDHFHHRVMFVIRLIMRRSILNQMLIWIVAFVWAPSMPRLIVLYQSNVGRSIDWSAFATIVQYVCNCHAGASPVNRHLPTNLRTSWTERYDYTSVFNVLSALYWWNVYLSLQTMQIEVWAIRTSKFLTFSAEPWSMGLCYLGCWSMQL